MSRARGAVALPGPVATRSGPSAIGILDVLTRGRSRLTPLEGTVLRLVADVLAAEARSLFDAQMELVNRVQRHGKGTEVNFYRMRRGRVFVPEELLFPLRPDEARLATIEVAPPGADTPLRADVWLVQGFVFSITFSRPPPKVAPDGATLSVRLWVDPMVERRGEQSAMEPDAVARWLGALADEWPPADARAPGLAAVPGYEELGYDLPRDARELFGFCGGFTIDRWRVHGPGALRTVTSEGREMLVLAEGLEGEMLVSERDEGGHVAYIYHDWIRAVYCANGLRDALERVLSGDRPDDTSERPWRPPPRAITIRLTDAQRDHLLKRCALPTELADLVEHAAETGGALTPSKQQLDELAAIVGSRLQAVGFGQDDEPTAEGRMLESILDALFE